MLITDDSLNDLLEHVKPSMVTPHLSEFIRNSNDSKLKSVGKLIVKSMAEQYNGDGKAKTPKVITHQGKNIEIRYLDVEPLMSGVWSSMSLALLQLSYGEQVSLIEAMYPQPIQITAKAFAAIFTNVGGNAERVPVEIKQDPETDKKLDSANAGIALVLAMLEDEGLKRPHIDHVQKQQDILDLIVDEANEKEKYQKSKKRQKQAEGRRK